MTQRWAAVAAVGGSLLLAGCAGTGQPAATPTPTPTVTPTSSVPAEAATICARLHQGDAIVSIGHDMWANSSIYPDQATAVYRVRQVVKEYCPQYGGQ